MERVVYKSSVRELVEFILRSGDIDNRIVGRDQLKAMQEGSRIHRKIQNSMGPSYLPEVPLYHLIKLEECMIYGHLGDLAKARELFDEYYASALQTRSHCPGHIPYLDELRCTLGFS